MAAGGQSGGGGTPRQFDEEADTAETPKPPEVLARRRIPFWEALGSERELQDGKKVWVIFSDAVVRITLTGRWTVSRRGPRLLQELSPSDTQGNEIHVWTRDGVLALQRGLPGPGYDWELGELRCDPGCVTGELVDHPDGPFRVHVHTVTEIVRVSR